MKYRSYKLFFLLSLIVLFTGLFSCRKEVRPWSAYLDFPPSFLKIADDSLLALHYSSESQNDTIPIKGDVTYEAGSDADWINVPGSNKRHADLIVHLEENKSQDPRTATILVTSLDTLPSIAIKVIQEGAKPFMKVSEDMVALDSTLFSVEVAENIEKYDIKAPWWITVFDSAKVNDFTTKYIFKVAASYFEDRMGEVEFIGKGENTDLKDTIVVKQLKTKFQDPSADLPTASLFDVAFTAQNVKDYSPFQFDITPGPAPDKPVLSFNDDLNMYTASFNADKNTLYKLDYVPQGSKFTDGFHDHFTMEVYFKPDLTNTGVATVIGSLLFGGLTIEYDNSGTLVMQLGSADKGFYDYFTIGNTHLEAGKYYDVVYTVNYGAKKAEVYVNGVFEGETDIDDSGYRLPFYNSDRWFGFGCNETSDGKGKSFFTGDIAFARFYSDVKTASEIQAMDNQIQARKALTNISDLNNAIVNVLPQKLTSASQDQKEPIQDAINIGWKLMSRVGTTGDMIQTYLHNVQDLLNSLK